MKLYKLGKEFINLDSFSVIEDCVGGCYYKLWFTGTQYRTITKVQLDEILKILEYESGDN